ncbi:MAG TPA: hypothetical protein VF066_08270 [Thermoleophilaceae bacterium]
MRAASSDRGVSVLTRPDQSAQGDDLVANRHPDPVGANDRVEPDRVPHALNDLFSRDRDPHLQPVAHLRYTAHPPGDPLGSLALRSDIDDSTQRHPADVDVAAVGRQSVEEEEGIEGRCLRRGVSPVCGAYRFGGKQRSGAKRAAPSRGADQRACRPMLIR